MQPDYYLDNFFLVLDTVVERDEHLFDASELDLFYRLHALPSPELRLIVRLFNRRGPYFRVDRLQYPEIPSARDTVASLEARGLVRWYRAVGSSEHVEPQVECRRLDLEAALRAYTLVELRAVSRQFELDPAPRRNLLGALLKIDPGRLADHLLEIGDLVEIVHRPLLERVQLLFFLNSRQDVSTLVTSHLALVRFPAYRVWRTRPVFPDRGAFEEFLEAGAEREALQNARIGKDMELAERVGGRAFEAFLDSCPSASGFLERFDARFVRAGTAMEYARIAESRCGPAEAARVYAALLDAGLPERYRGRARVRYALNLQKAGDLVGALAACSDGLADPAVREGECVELQQRRKRLLAAVSRARRGGEAGETGVACLMDGAVPAEGHDLDAKGRAAPVREVVVRRPVACRGPARRLLFTDAGGNVVSVESVALAAYRAAGLDGVSTENTFFTTLFGILFWDILFSAVPDVFQAPYQDAPLDLGTEAFYSARREAIRERVEELKHAGLEVLREHYTRYRGMSARGVAWDAYSLDQLAEGMRRLGGASVAAILDHLARDYASRRRGMPDLLVWSGGPGEAGDTGQAEDRRAGAYWGDTEYEPLADVWFVEVKSRRDRLGPHQRAWIRTLDALGLKVEVCRVLGPEDGAVEDCRPRKVSRGG